MQAESGIAVLCNGTSVYWGDGSSPPQAGSASRGLECTGESVTLISIDPQVQGAGRVLGSRLALGAAETETERAHARGKDSATACRPGNGCSAPSAGQMHNALRAHRHPQTSAGPLGRVHACTTLSSNMALHPRGAIPVANARSARTVRLVLALLAAIALGYVAWPADHAGQQYSELIAATPGHTSTRGSETADRDTGRPFDPNGVAQTHNATTLLPTISPDSRLAQTSIGSPSHAPSAGFTMSGTVSALATPSETSAATASISPAGSVGSPYANPHNRVHVGAGFDLTKPQWDAFVGNLTCQTTLGRWVHRDERVVIVPRPLMPDSWCGDPPYTEDAKPGLWYSWEAPSQCMLKPFSREDFCRAMGGRDLLIVGDSISFSVHDTIISAMYDTAPVPHDQRLTPCPWHPFCEPEAAAMSMSTDQQPIAPFRMKFIRNDRLSTRTEYYAETTAFIEIPWVQDVRPGMIILMNRGAHYDPHEKFSRELTETFRWLRDNHPDTMVIFRNTPPGHEGFLHLTVPLAARPENTSDLPYHWGAFLQQNYIAADIARAFPGVVYLDVDNSTALRADSHRDGLHYCIPGPIDTWLVFLQNLLSMLQRAAAS